jgi:hypothetical protein
VATVREFIDFWLENSVHADEEDGPQRGPETIQRLAGTLIRAAEDQGFSEADVKAELGDLGEVIRAIIDRKNADEEARRGKRNSQ